MSQSYSSRHSDNRVGPTADKMSPSVVESQLQELQQRSAGQEALTLEQCRSLKPDDMARREIRRFFHSVREGNSDQVSLLLKCNSSLVSKLDEQLMSGLHYAVKCNRVDMVSLLMQAGANVNIKGREGSRPIHPVRILDMQDSEGNSSVHFAAKNDKFLLEQSAPIHLAATLGHRESVAKLIHLGALPNLSDKNGRTPLHCCIIARQLEICDTLLLAGAQSRAADEDFMTPLHWACRRGLTQAARRLLRVDPGLHWAVLACAVDLVELLLAQAGDSDESANASDFHDKYPLAVKLGHEGLVRDICGLGQYIKRQALRHRDLRGVTSLLIAAEHGHTRVLHFLLEQGADFTAKDEFGRTALMLSCGGGHSDIVATMIDKGVDVTRRMRIGFQRSFARTAAVERSQLQQNYNGETPVDVAVLNNNGPAISLLFSDAYQDLHRSGYEN
uniref:ANK_REP_REGION domain-containing protein n=1 Tax=Macrostomum lignano TaxID=282301 RepID=A0A1I8F252_9PLAT